MHRIYIGLGLVMLAFPLVLDFLVPDNGMGDVVLLALVTAGSVLLVTGIWLHQRNAPAVADERFVLHRLKSSRFGLIMGLLAILALSFYRAYMEDTLPWDLVAVAFAMAAGKLTAMVYYKLTG